MMMMMSKFKRIINPEQVKYTYKKYIYIYIYIGKNHPSRKNKWNKGKIFVKALKTCIYEAQNKKK
jgi:hypothetical protein